MYDKEFFELIDLREEIMALSLVINKILMKDGVSDGQY